MPKMCYCGLKLSKRIYKYALIMPLLVYIFVKRNIHKKESGHCTFFFHNHNYHAGKYK